MDSVINITEMVKPKWISVKDWLPEPEIDEEGNCSVVLVRWKREYCPDIASVYQTCNTEYLKRHPDKFTHWMPLPEPPESEEECTTVHQQKL